MDLRSQIQARFDCGGDILGDDAGDVNELTFLGRKLIYSKNGLEWQGDRRIVDSFLRRAGIEEGQSVGSVDTPGVKHAEKGGGLQVAEGHVEAPGEGAQPQDTEQRPLLDGAAATQHRGLVALLNYIAQDRPDLSFCAKELSQTMARPRVGDERGIKRAVRYLRRFPVASICHEWQEDPSKVVVFTDADWGGCEKTRRSTSGGLIMHGTHLLSFWSRTQQCVALSSCESEVNALVKGGVEGLGVKHMVAQCGYELDLDLKTDASAAQGLCARQGAGRVKHLTVRQLWAQEREACGDLKIKKVPRSANCADMLTHHRTHAEGQKFLSLISIRRFEDTAAFNARRRVGDMGSG